jgi:hypothetical protein
VSQVHKENRAYKEYELEVKSKSGKIFRIRKRGYAQVTDSYNNWKDALTKMLKDCNFKGDMSLFNSFN